LLQGIKVLVAEDNNLNQRIVSFILQKQHADMAIVNNGSLAVARLREENFDVVLMDLQMPELDGFEAAEVIRRELKSTIPIIALSASKLTADMDKCLEAGMNASISKPFDPTELCELILKVIREHHNITGKHTL
jgi:CheY-like chemotaxis protein